MRTTHRMITMLSCVVMSFTMTACSSIDAGTVVEKEYEPAYTVLQPSCAGYNGSGGCIAWVQVPIHADEKWTITFENDMFSQDSADQKREKRTIEVTEEVYDVVSPGDEVSLQQEGYLIVNNEKLPL